MAGWTIWNPPRVMATRPPMANLVYYKFDWFADWQWAPGAWCSRIEDKTSPGTSSASIEYDFGVILPAGRTAAMQYPPGNLLGAYVLVEGVNAWGRYPLWVGVVQREETRAWGNVNAPTGQQQYLAVGLEQLLDRVEIRGAYTASGQTDRALEFNRARGFGVGVAPNMTIDGGGWPVFGRAQDGAGLWTYRAALDYLMRWYAPTTVRWDLATPDIVNALGVLPPMNLDGYTIRQALDELFDRRHGLGWCMRVDSYANVALIHVFTSVADAIAIGDTVIPANPAQTDVYYEGNRDADPVFSFSDTARYDAVEVLGGPVYTTLTFTEALLPRVHEQTGQPGDGQLEGEDARLSRTASYALRPDWDWFTPWGHNAAPGVEWDGALVGDALPPVYNDAREFERQLPIPGVGEDPRPPIAVVWHDSKWQLAERAVRMDGDIQKSVSIGLKLLDNEVGFSFLWTEQEGEESPLPAPGDWMLTATLATDRRLAVRVSITGAPVDATRVRSFSMPEAVAHWICPNTVTDVTADGNLIQYGGNPVYYTDAAMLHNVAALAATWFGRRRSTLDVAIEGITFEYLPASLIRDSRTSWFAVPVETVVTERVWDFRNQTTRVHTSYEEIAAMEMLR